MSLRSSFRTRTFIFTFALGAFSLAAVGQDVAVHAQTTGERTPVVTGEKTPAVTGEKTPAKSGEKTPAKSGEKTPAKSGEKTPAKSGEKTPAKSGEKTPAKSGEKAAVTTAEAAAIADKVQNFYDSAKTYKASFKQTYTIEAYGKTKSSEGTVVFEKPGKMSWRYSSNKNRVVSDGKLLKVYEADNKQMYEQPVTKSQYPAALSFLLGNGNLKKEFSLSLVAGEKLKFPGGLVLIATPKEATPAYEQMLLYVDSKTYQVRRVLLVDAQRNRNRFDFVTPEVNTKLAAQEFSFVPPAGTRVIKP